jgi:fatty-acyl-CoA synthase
VTYTHRSSFLHALRLLQADVIGVTAADSVLTVVPMFHANAWGLPFAVPAAGAKLVLPGRHADGANLARLIAAEEVTIAVGVPTVWLGLIEHLDATGSKLPSLKHPGRRCASATCAHGAHGAAPRCFGSEELGYDRTVSVRDDVAPT